MSFFFLVIVSFVLVAFGEPAWFPLLAPIAATVGYALFWKAMLQKPSRAYRFSLATFWFASIFAVHLSWMTTTAFVGASILILYFILIFAIGVQFGLLSLLIPFNKQLSLSRILFISGVWVFMEYSRLFVLSGFSWNPVGLSLTAFNLSLQLVSVVGIYGLSFLVICANLLALKVIINRGTLKTKIAWIASAIFPYIFGFFTLAYHEKESMQNKEGFLSALLVQTAVLPNQKASFDDGEKQLTPLEQWEKILYLLSEHRGRDIDLIVFPEGTVSYPSDLLLYSYDSLFYHFDHYFGGKSVAHLPPLIEPLAVWQEDRRFWAVSNRYWAWAISNVFSADVVVGLEAIEKRGEQFLGFQSAFYVKPGTHIHDHYDKQILVPIGEYIPFSWCKKLASRFGIYDSFTPGNCMQVFDGKVVTSLSICYEETYGHLMREGKLQGSKCFVNITNDGWYPGSKLPEQHFYHSRLRSVENGVPLIRACNTGVTAVVDSVGRVICQIPLEHELSAGGILAKVPLYSYNTLYTYWGDYCILTISLVCVLSFLLKIKTKDML
ncbi:MAG: apolipoprotein N-acyltransferase [Chlamydiales bacterium]|nr:apolipoprotein N-acyltransferase [Chlamydiales bacterium]